MDGKMDHVINKGIKMTNDADDKQQQRTTACTSLLPAFLTPLAYLTCVDETVEYSSLPTEKLREERSYKLL